MTRGTDTKAVILSTGLEMASQLGLECVTIGNLAKETHLSKSGLFAHFQSKENLQMEILKYAGEDFRLEVIIPALKTRSGIPRIKKLIDLWIKYGSKIKGGCIFVSAGTEYSDRPGKIRDFLLSQQNEWIDCLKRIAISAVEAKHFKTDIDPDQFAYDLYALLLGFHYYHRLLNDKEAKKRQESSLRHMLLKYISSPALIE